MELAVAEAQSQVAMAVCWHRRQVEHHRAGKGENSSGNRGSFLLHNTLSTS